MTKERNLTKFIQIRVTARQKACIQLMARKRNNNVSELIYSLLYDELSRLSLIDNDLNEARKKLIEG